MKGIRLFFDKIGQLFRQPLFVALTLFGNGLIAAGTIALYALEHDINPKIQTHLDTLWWAVATVTTVGYGDIIPVTPGGKMVGIVMMLAGIALFWAYTGLFASTLLSAELSEVEAEIQVIEKSLRKLTRSRKLSKDSRDRLITQMEETLEKLRT